MESCSSSGKSTQAFCLSIIYCVNPKRLLQKGSKKMNYISKDRDKVVCRLTVKEKSHLAKDFAKMKEKTAFYILDQEGQKKKKEGKHKNSHLFDDKKAQGSQVKLYKTKASQTLPLFVFRNKSNQKIAKKFDIENSSEFLIIQKASIIEKEVLSSVNSISSRRSSFSPHKHLQVLPDIQKKKRENKMSAFFNANLLGTVNSNSREAKLSLRSKQNGNINDRNKMNPQQFFYRKLQRYFKIVEEKCLQSGMKYESAQAYTDTLQFFAQEGNGINSIEQAFKKRFWWKNLKEKESKIAQFHWTQLIQEKFSTTVSTQAGNSSPLRQNHHQNLHNHLKGNKYITHPISLFEISRTINNSSAKVLKRYYVKGLDSQQWARFQVENYSYDYRSKNILLTYLNDNNKWWIVKNASNSKLSSFLNIFKDYDELESFLKVNLSSQQTFILEQYIQEPFLYESRKFSVKMYILLTKLKEKVIYYCYNEGFINVSSETYDRKSKNPYVHFTTQNIQFSHSNYGSGESLNKLTFSEFQSYLSSKNSQFDFFGNAFPSMKQTVKEVVQCVLPKLETQGTPSYQLMQFNFVMDRSFVPWLISAHTNPSLESTSSSVECFYSKLIDDSLKLTIDLVYPPPKIWPRNKMYLLNNKIFENGFESINLLKKSQNLKTFVNQTQIDYEDRCFESSIEQQEIALMHFFPQKMRSSSSKSTNFS